MTDLHEIIPPSHKFALFALHIGVDDTVPDGFKLADGLYVTRKLTIDVAAHWKEWLGSLAWDELHEADLFVWATMPTAKPDILDEENAALQRRVYMLYYGLVLAMRHIATTRRTIVVTGAREKDVDVRQHGWIPELIRSDGVFWDAVTRADLEEALAIGNALAGIQNLQDFRRLRAGFKCFYTGLQADDPPERIHEFVRAIEGCLLPAIGNTKAQFKNRTELFVGPSYHSWAETLFNVRSAVEHLNDRMESVAIPTRKEAILRVLKLAHESQAVARYCLKRILSEEALREHFRNDAKLASFWALEEPARRAIWGAPLTLKQVSAQFEEEYAAVQIEENDAS